MDNIKLKVKKFIIWVLSNTLWTIITLIIPFSFLIVPFRNIIDSISNKSYTIKLIYILPVIAFIITETAIIICLLTVRKKNKSNSIIHSAEDTIEENDYDYNNLDYYFEDYSKHLTIYKNGNGILINSFTIVINNIDSISQFKRELNIKDSCKDTYFPKLSKMKKTSIDKRFDDFVFKCKCINNKELIHSIEEKYWTDTSDNNDNFSKDDPKILKWILKMNLSSVEAGKPYKIVYVISIPKMFPIENGFFKEEIANIKNTHGKFTSQFSVGHKIKKFVYTISFENDIILHKTPIGKFLNASQPKNIHYINDNNIIYNKYIFNAEHLDDGCMINIEWFFKERISKQGGRKNDKSDFN